MEHSSQPILNTATIAADLLPDHLRFVILLGVRKAQNENKNKIRNCSCSFLSFIFPFVGLWRLSFEGKAMCLLTSALKF